MILQIVPDLDIGGAERSAVEISAAITKAGGRALVASRGGRMEQALKDAGGELIRFPANAKNPLTILANARRLVGLIKQYNVTLLHARSRAPAWSAWLASLHTGIPFVTTYHGAYNENGRIKRIYNSVMARSAIVIANSHYTANLIRERYNTPSDRIRVIYRGLDGEFDQARITEPRRQAIRARWGLRNERVVLLAARLTSWKGQSVLIEASGLLAASNRLPDDVCIVLAGDAQGREQYLADLKRRITAHHLDGRIHLVGLEADMPTAFAEAHVSVVASTEPEAFGRSGAESQAMGCPVIATRLGAPPETVLAEPDFAPDEITGWLTPPGDAAALADVLAHALSLDHVERAEIGIRGRRHVMAQFTLARMQHQTLQVYDQLLHSTMAKSLITA